MNTQLIERNTATISSLYNRILNERRLQELEAIVSADYVNKKKQKGVEAFKNGIEDVLNSFEDARWTITELVADERKVILKQTMSGTHTATFQGIARTGKHVRNTGFAIYHLVDGKIIAHEVLTDRLDFLQQLGVQSRDVKPETSLPIFPSAVYFVDRFCIPSNAVAEFIVRTEYNRAFIKTLPGFKGDAIFTNRAENGDTIVLTIAVWESPNHLEKAKQEVQREYKTIGFDPKQFLESHSIRIEREQYRFGIEAN